MNDPRTEHREWAKQERIVAFAGYPLLVEGRLFGVLAMFARQTLGPDSLEALASVADTVAQGADRKQTEEKLIAYQRQWEEAQLLASLGSCQQIREPKVLDLNARRGPGGENAMAAHRRARALGHPAPTAH
jgi:GAF domain-containing protein